jgi:hypothetical protein
MEWFLIISLVSAGLLLLIVEVLFIPGTTLIGVLGIIILLAGVMLSFHNFGSEIGWLVAGTSFFISGGVLYFSFRSKVWSRFSLKTAIESKAHESLEGIVLAGAEGITTSALRPVGNAEIDGGVYEVKTLGGYLDAGKKIRVIRVIENQIIVETID